MPDKPLSPDEFDAMFPNASRGTRNLAIRAWEIYQRQLREPAAEPEAAPAEAARPIDPTAETCSGAPGPFAEQDSRPQSVGEIQAEGNDPKRFLVRIKSVRSRLLDPDNLVGGVKYHLDACRQCGAIPDDAPHAIKLEVSQTKAASKLDEKTIIEIFPPGTW